MIRGQRHLVYFLEDRIILPSDGVESVPTAGPHRLLGLLELLRLLRELRTRGLTGIRIDLRLRQFRRLRSRECQFLFRRVLSLRFGLRLQLCFRSSLRRDTTATRQSHGGTEHRRYHAGDHAQVGMIRSRHLLADIGDFLIRHLLGCARRCAGPWYRAGRFAYSDGWSHDSTRRCRSEVGMLLHLGDGIFGDGLQGFFFGARNLGLTFLHSEVGRRPFPIAAVIKELLA